jgi:hypothetical protein
MVVSSLYEPNKEIEKLGLSILDWPIEVHGRNTALT